MGEVDKLAAVIREVDGSHNLGAGGLAEKLIERGVLIVRPDWVMDLDVTMTALEEFAPDSAGHRRMMTRLRALIEEVAKPTP